MPRPEVDLEQDIADAEQWLALYDQMTGPGPGGVSTDLAAVYRLTRERLGYLRLYRRLARRAEEEDDDRT